MTKRAADILIASVLLVLTLPVVLVSAIGSAIVLRAWPFFVQRRVGWDGRTFRFVKIRTLPTSTPAYLLKNDLELAEVPRFARALRRSPRSTFCASRNRFKSGLEKASFWSLAK